MSKKSIRFYEKHVIAVLIICMAFLACIFSGTAFAASDDVTPDNGIPVVTVVIEENAEVTDDHGEVKKYATIDEMNRSKNHTAECYGTVKIDVPEGFRYSDFPDGQCESLEACAMEIRGRGNSSWGKEKKPYKIKLAKKKSVLGLGKNKHWVLLANAYDRTLIKDRITAWLGAAFNMEFTPRGFPVDFVMKNTEGTYSKYLGSYYLSENVRVDENRVDIHELQEEDTEPEDITGGYLVQGGLQVDDESLNKFFTKRGLELSNKGPEFDTSDGGYENDAQKNYIRNYIQRVEDALFEGDFDGEEGESYRDLMDVESAAKYWLIDQVSMNTDGYETGSTYLYKKEDTVVDGETVPGKLYWGPLWDFDYAWYYDLMKDGYTGFEVRHQWLLPMMYDIGNGGFVQEVRKQWPALKAALTELAKDGGVIDKYRDETARSFAADIIVNPLTEEDYTYDTGEFVYEDQINDLKAWIINRTAWMDRHIMRTHDLESLVHKITLEADGEVISEKYAAYGSYFNNLDNAPDKAGFTFIGWIREDGDLLSTDDKVTKDTTLRAMYLPDEQVTHVTALYIRQNVMYADIKDDSTMRFEIPYTVLPENAQDKKVYWESSDEETASIEDGGFVNVHKAGTVTITGKLKSGAVKSFTLIVTDGEMKDLKGIKITKKEIFLQKGQYGKVDVVNEPENSRTWFLDIRSSDPEVVDVDPNGVLHGLKTGSATITAESVTEDKETGEEIKLFAKCKVYVTGPNTMKAKGRAVKIKYSKVKKKTRKIKRAKAITIKKAVGKVTYRRIKITAKKKLLKQAKKKIRVAKNGKIILRKGLKKGVYKLTVRVRAAGDKAFRPLSKKVKIKIKVV